VLAGAPLEEPVLFEENGLNFEADLILGQKTGFFFDQRENRSILERIIAGSKNIDTLLNVFAYTGGFSLYAARAGARKITSLDSSRPALDMATKNFELNKNIKSISTSIHSLACGDAFQMLEKYGAEGRRFDSVVIDPPSFAKRQSEADQALKAYRWLTRLGLSVLRPGGLLVMSSCSSRVGAEEFFTEINRVASRNDRPLSELTSTGHALDHPVNFSQGAYLKCLFAIA
jgi:23S rRNA (cytosine1962-C5)-methyltransferase